MYRLYVPGGGFVCKGSYIYQGEKYKVLGEHENAKIYKTRKAAQNDWKRLMNTHANIDYDIRILYNDREEKR